MKTYDPNKVDFSFAGIYLNEGTAPGTVLTITPSKPGFSGKAGTDGGVTRTRSANRMATAKLVLMASSDVNKRLSDRYEADRNATNGNGVGVFSVQDRGGESIGEAQEAWISQDPDMTVDEEAPTREWTFELANWRPTHGGNLNGA